MLHFRLSVKSAWPNILQVLHHSRLSNNTTMLFKNESNIKTIKISIPSFQFSEGESLRSVACLDL